MHWPCKSCTFVSSKRGQLLKHCRLKHGGLTRSCPILCLHQKCLCTFNSFNALKVHLSKCHSQITHTEEREHEHIFNCQLCEFNETCTEQDFLRHLRQHPKLFQKIECPYLDCDFETNVYSTFNTLKSRNHNQTSIDVNLAFKPEIVSQLSCSEESAPVASLDELTSEDEEMADIDVQDLDIQLEHN